MRRPQLHDISLVEDKDLIRSGDCVESVGDDHDGAVFELLFDGRLDQSVRLDVNGRCRLVQQQNLVAPK